MDPNVTLQLALDESRTSDERAESAADLLDWIDRGGFLPEYNGHVSTLMRRLSVIAHHGTETP